MCCGLIIMKENYVAILSFGKVDAAVLCLDAVCFFNTTDSMRYCHFYTYPCVIFLDFLIWLGL